MKITPEVIFMMQNIPMHFLVFIMNAELYYEGLVASMNEEEEDE